MAADPEGIEKGEPLDGNAILTGPGIIDSVTGLYPQQSDSYLQKPCEFDRLSQMVTEAYRQKVMNRLKVTDERIGELLNIS